MNIEIHRTLPPHMYRDDNGSFDPDLFEILWGDNIYSEIKKVPSDKAFYSPRLSPKDFLELSEMDFNDFNNKKIVDIWWWAWCLALFIKNNSKPESIEIVDPIFQEFSFDKIVEDTINKLQWFITSDEKNYKEDDPYKDKKLQQTQNRKQNKEVLEKYQQWIYSWVKINWSYWDNIKEIESDSQDVVFINHLLHKLDEQEVINILKEANRILKEDWKIIIIEYPNENIVKSFDKINLITKRNDDAVCITLNKNKRKLLDNNILI